MRRKIYNILKTNQDSKINDAYDWFMLFCIVISIIPLAFREQNIWFEWVDKVSVTVFIVDYILRWMTADMQMPNRPRWQAFLLYPFTAFAIVDLLSILPSFVVINKAFKLFRMTRLLKILRVFRFIRYSKNVQILLNVLRKERHILFVVFWIAIAYILTTALVMFNAEESEMFKNFFDALYWATTTLTTVGYGDICPTSSLGRIISMISAIFGVAIIALPSGVITASYLEELREAKENEEEQKMHS